jgi:hypothetical protein
MEMIMPRRLITGLCGVLLSIIVVADEADLTVAVTQSAGQEMCKTGFNHGELSGVYVGRCTAGVPDGPGIVNFRNGDRYEGNFANGLMHGTGTWSYASGDSYRGQWQAGKRDGRGVYRWARGSVYSGEFANDLREGQGTYTWTNGDRFEGEFRNNQHYNGTFFTARGNLFRCRAGDCR